MRTKFAPTRSWWGRCFSGTCSNSTKSKLYNESRNFHLLLLHIIRFFRPIFWMILGWHKGIMDGGMGMLSDSNASCPPSHQPIITTAPHFITMFSDYRIWKASFRCNIKLTKGRENTSPSISHQRKVTGIGNMSEAPITIRQHTRLLEHSHREWSLHSVRIHSTRICSDIQLLVHLY